MSIDKDWVAVRDGRGTLTLDADRGAVVLITPGSDDEIATIPTASDFSGGHEFVVSDDERHVALFVYSGQSSQGYELFALQPTLAHIGGLPEVFGEGAAPAFSPGCRWVVMFTTDDPFVRETDEHFDEIHDAESDATVVVDWARLRVRRLPDMTDYEVPVGVQIPLSTDPDVLREWTLPEAVRFDSEDIAMLHMPWGEVIPVSLPPQAVTSHGFVAPDLQR